MTLSRCLSVSVAHAPLSTSARVKEAMVVLLDAGASMCAPLRDQRKANAHESDRRRFDAAIAAVDNVLQQKVRGNQSDLWIYSEIMEANKRLNMT